MSSIAPASMGDGLLTEIQVAFAGDKPLRRVLETGGALHLDRQVPFLIVTREPVNGGAAIGRLIAAESSYLVTSAAPADLKAARELIAGIVSTVSPSFGSFLLLELWPSPEWKQDGAPRAGREGPRFQVFASGADELGEVLPGLVKDLSQLSVSGHTAEVNLVQSDEINPPGIEPLFSAVELTELGCVVLGVELSPLHVDPATEAPFPAVVQELRRGLSRVLRRAFHKFSCALTTHCPVNYHVLGPRALVKSVWEVDEKLAEVADSFDFLLQVTPVNHQQAWEEFEKHQFDRTPVFHYRPQPVEPIVVKRQLYKVPVEKIDDPAMALLFREKLDEVDRMVTMLHDMNTRRFAFGSAQLYGSVDDAMMTTATELLAKGAVGGERRDAGEPRLDAAAFALRAEGDIALYKQQAPGLDPKVEIRADITSGLMVSRGGLIVGKYAQIPESRVEALLAHEVGTHMLTYYNGKAQPMRQLYSGLAGYEELQEGTAVLAEYLVGGLSAARLRLLAARVVAVHQMMSGASFVDVFRGLTRDHGMAAKTAFTLTTRVYRGGGLCKDAVYLRGLESVLQYLAEGGDVESLFIGKLARPHIPILRELQWRGVLSKPLLRPNFLDRSDVQERLKRLRCGVKLSELV